jgi:hypothetical protein
MSADQQEMRDVTMRFFGAINTGNLGQIDKAVDEIYAPDVVLHYPPMPDLAPGSAGIKQFLHGMFTNYSHIHIDLDGIFGEGDNLAQRYTWQATNVSTGKRTILPLVNIGRWAEGKIVEEWEVGGPAKEE